MSIDSRFKDPSRELVASWNTSVPLVDKEQKPRTFPLAWAQSLILHAAFKILRTKVWFCWQALGPFESVFATVSTHPTVTGTVSARIHQVPPMCDGGFTTATQLGEPAPPGRVLSRWERCFRSSPRWGPACSWPRRYWDPWLGKRLHFKAMNVADFWEHRPNYSSI